MKKAVSGNSIEEVCAEIVFWATVAARVNGDPFKSATITLGDGGGYFVAILETEE